MRVLRTMIQADSFIVSGESSGQCGRLNFQYQITSFAATSKVKYIKHILLVLITQNSVFGSVFKGSLRTCYSLLWQPFLRTAGKHWTTWWSSTKCNIQRVMIQINSQWRGMYLLVLIKCLHFALKCYFISKTVRCFWGALYPPQRMSAVNSSCRVKMKTFELVNIQSLDVQETLYISAFG